MKGVTTDRKNIQMTSPKLLHLFLLFAVTVFVAAPIVFVFVGAFEPKDGHFAPAIVSVFGTTYYVGSLLSTLKLSFSVGLASAALGLTLAWSMSRFRPKWGAFLEIGIMTPIFVSPFIGSVGWLILAQPNTGLLNVLFKEMGLSLRINVFSFSGAVFVLAFFFSPFAYSLLKHSIDRLNQELEEAASVSGAHSVTIFTRITLPLIWPSLLSSLIITFVITAEVFSIPAFFLVPFGDHYLAYDLYENITRWPIDYSKAAAIGLVLLAITVVGMLLYSWSIRLQERFVSVGPKSARLGGIETMGAKAWVGSAIIGTFIIITSILPIIAIIFRSFVPYFSGKFSMSIVNTKYFFDVLHDHVIVDALVRSLIVMTVSTTLLILLAFLIAFSRIRHRSQIATLVWVIASLPIAVPGVLMGVGILWMYVGSPLYATIWVIILVMLSRFLPILVRMFEGGLIQLGKELEEAAAVCGASQFVTIFKIYMPLLAGTLRSAIIVAATVTFSELSASAILYTNSSAVLPVILFNYARDGEYSRASVVALMQVTVLLAGVSVIVLAGKLFQRKGSVYRG